MCVCVCACVIPANKNVCLEEVVMSDKGRLPGTAFDTMSSKRPQRLPLTHIKGYKTHLILCYQCLNLSPAVSLSLSLSLIHTHTCTCVFAERQQMGCDSQTPGLLRPDNLRVSSADQPDHVCWIHHCKPDKSRGRHRKPSTKRKLQSKQKLCFNVC